MVGALILLPPSSPLGALLGAWNEHKRVDDQIMRAAASSFPQHRWASGKCLRQPARLLQQRGAGQQVHRHSAALQQAHCEQRLRSGAAVVPPLRSRGGGGLLRGAGQPAGSVGLVCGVWRREEGTPVGGARREEAFYQ